jgi:hypothetical protein
MHSPMFKSLSITNDMPTSIHKTKNPKLQLYTYCFSQNNTTHLKLQKVEKQKTNQHVHSMTKVKMGVFLTVIYVSTHQNLSSKMDIIVKSDAKNIFLPLHKTFIPINKERLSPHCLFSNDAQCNNVQTLIVNH